MRHSRLTGFTAGLLLLFSALTARASTNDHPSFKHPVSLPPSANLFYDINAQYGVLNMRGNAQVQWNNSGRHFYIHAETTTAGLGKILGTKSAGIVNAYGLAPTNLIETRFRKKPHTVTFDHATKTISFSSSQQTYPLKGGEQDRTSITWQMVSIARGAPDKLVPGTEWSFFVAGRKNAEVWQFRVIGLETIQSPLGNIPAVHIAKLPSESREGQSLDLWLAPSLEWYPVKMVFKDEKGINLDQILQRIDKPVPQHAAKTGNTP